MKIQIIKTFECDEKIIDSIKILIEKGYDTTFCCSGHEDDLYPYVKFNRNAYWISRLKDSHPENWEYDGVDVIRRCFTKEEFKIHTPLELIDKSMEELYKWAETLPYIGYMYTDVSVEKI